LALVTISNHSKHLVLMPKCRLYSERDIKNAPKVFHSAFICCRTAEKKKSNLKNQCIWIESEMCKVYFQIVMQNVLGVNTEAKQVGV
jgi:hypothetical protein